MSVNRNVVNYSLQLETLIQKWPCWRTETCRYWRKNTVLHQTLWRSPIFGGHQMLIFHKNGMYRNHKVFFVTVRKLLFILLHWHANPRSGSTWAKPILLDSSRWSASNTNTQNIPHSLTWSNEYEDIAYNRFWFTSRPGYLGHPFWNSPLAPVRFSFSFTSFW